jgi:stage III sporulation protein AF
MNWLGSWLKELVVIILFAAFVDILLPNRSLQRYVKAVVGLFILMVLLTPVFQFLQRDWNPEKLLAAASVDKSGPSPPTLDAILEQANRFRLTGQSQAQKLAANQAAAAMMQGLRQEGEIAAVEVKPVTSVDAEGHFKIDRVEVTLGGTKPESDIRASGGTDGPTIGVEPVKPVIIRIEPDRQPSPTAPNGAGTQRDVVREDRVALYMSREWRLEPGQIRISWR